MRKKDHLERPEDVIVEHSLCLDFHMTNNQTEYEALIIELKLAKDIGIKPLIAKSDSQFIVDEVNKTYETKVPCLNRCLKKVKGQLENFDHFELEKISQLENNHANALVKLMSMKASTEN